MRTRALALSLAGCAVVVAGSWEAGQLATAATGSAAPSAAPAPASSGSASSSSATSGTTSSSSSASAAPSTTSSGTTGTFAGTTEETQFGPMQVEVVVTNGRITDVKALQLTNDGQRSADISAQAAPMLREEALSAQSAKIDVISGATYTSEGYIASLQSALDKAGL
jgi:uncharacterized protein with FMN-binding domain